MIKTLLLVSILSSGVQYQTEYDNIEDCLKAKEEILQVNPEGVEAYCVTKSERQQTQVDRDMEEASKRLTRTIISTFQSIMTKVMIDIQKDDLDLNLQDNYFVFSGKVNGKKMPKELLSFIYN